MPTSISFENRNPGHWDVYCEQARALLIRGEPGAVTVHDERAAINGCFKPGQVFKTVEAAMAWCLAELMAEERDGIALSRIGHLRDALEYYAKHAAGCRLIHNEGDQHRQALQRDGGERAREALSRMEEHER